MLSKLKLYCSLALALTVAILGGLVAYYKRKLFITDTLSKNANVMNEINKENAEAVANQALLKAEEQKRKDLENAPKKDYSDESAEAIAADLANRK